VKRERIRLEFDVAKFTRDPARTFVGGLLDCVYDRVELNWIAFWRLIFGPRPELVAVYSDGRKIPLGFFGSWYLGDRPPHFLVKLEWEGVVIWERWKDDNV
jgi:hypothetical protein